VGEQRGSAGKEPRAEISAREEPDPQPISEEKGNRAVGESESNKPPSFELQKIDFCQRRHKRLNKPLTSPTSASFVAKDAMADSSWVSLLLDLQSWIASRAKVQIDSHPARGPTFRVTCPR
jgi:hypothetical protein